MNWIIALSTQNRSILLTEQESSPLLQNRIKKPKSDPHQRNKNRAKPKSPNNQPESDLGKIPCTHHRREPPLRQDGAEKTVGASKQAYWHGGHGDHRDYRGPPHPPCRTPPHPLFHKHHTESSYLSDYQQRKKKKKKKLRRSNQGRACERNEEAIITEYNKNGGTSLMILYSEEMRLLALKKRREEGKELV